MTPELEREIAETESGGPAVPRALCTRWEKTAGSASVGPKRYGGQERPPIEQFIFFDEVQRAGFPIPLLTLNTVGSDADGASAATSSASDFCRRFCSGELHFSIGYTEPSAGTDLAALKTTAVRDGDHYVVNGQKVFTSLAHHADYIWLAVRTDPDAPEAQGHLDPDRRQHAARRQDRADAHARRQSRVLHFLRQRTRAGGDARRPENQGWKIITTQLNYERISLFTAGVVERSLDEVTAWARSRAAPDGGTGDRSALGAGESRSRARRHRRAAAVQLAAVPGTCRRGALPPEEASAVKVYGSEFYVLAFRLLMEMLGERATLQARFAGRAAQGPARALLPRDAGADVRRRHQREFSATSSRWSASACRARRVDDWEPDGFRFQRRATGAPASWRAGYFASTHRRRPCASSSAGRNHRSRALAGARQLGAARPCAAG